MPSDYDDLRISFIDGEEGVADTIEIRRIGNRDNVFYKVSEKIDFLKAAFPREYEAYLKRQEDPKKSIKPVKIDGTELTEVDGISKRRSETLKRHEVHTVEQLANLSDVSCNGIGTEYLELRKEARKYLMDKSGQFPRQVVG
jgi:predicted flap endonuclease-1-like 5' DNA nuclease|tara:strand:- start:1433 stop:1858 length:426 start_codon:yes stop_codon:yes gene_type:complete